MAAQRLVAIQAPARVRFIGRSICTRALAEHVQRIARDVSAPLEVQSEWDEHVGPVFDPDVIVLCASECAGHDDPAVFSESRDRYPEALLIAMSPRAHTASLVTAIDAGARGFVACGIDDVDDVVNALVGVLQGEIAFSTAVSRLIIGELRNSGVSRRDPEAPGPLTAREKTALEQLASGRSNQQIATVLGISPNTVKNHLASAYRKLGVSSRLAAIAEAKRRRLI